MGNFKMLTLWSVFRMLYQHGIMLFTAAQLSDEIKVLTNTMSAEIWATYVSMSSDFKVFKDQVLSSNLI